MQSPNNSAVNTCENENIHLFAKIPPNLVLYLLRNNHVPSPSQTRLIQAAMPGVHSDLQRLDNEIDRVQTLLSGLIRNHGRLRKYYHCLQGLFSPIRHLPPEILSEIFLACLTFPCPGKVVFPARKDVLLFGQICRYWRDVAISTSTLWSALNIDLRAQNMDRELAMAPIWLARSGSAPLSLKLCSYSEGPQTHPITDVLLTHAPRFHTLALLVPLPIVYSFQTIRGRIPHLRHLIIVANDHHSPPTLLDAFEIAPELSYVELTVRVSFQNPNFPITQLRELRLSGHQYAVDDCLQALHSAPNLVKCYMNLSISQSHFPRTIVQHSHLRELYVEVDDLGTLVKYLALPALVSLSCSGYETWPQQDFLSFLSRSSCLLQELVLEACGYHTDRWVGFGDNLAECLQHIPSLMELELLEGVGFVIEGSFWVALTHRASSPCLVPKLRRIKVTRHFDFDYEEFVHMVESRWRVQAGQGANHVAVERIQSAEVCLMDDHEQWDMYNSLRHEDRSSRYFPLLHQLRAEGLEVIAPDIDADDTSSGSSEE